MWASRRGELGGSWSSIVVESKLVASRTTMSQTWLPWIASLVCFISISFQLWMFSIYTVGSCWRRILYNWKSFRIWRRIPIEKNRITKQGGSCAHLRQWCLYDASYLRRFRLTARSQNFLPIMISWVCTLAVHSVDHKLMILTSNKALHQSSIVLQHDDDESETLIGDIELRLTHLSFICWWYFSGLLYSTA